MGSKRSEFTATSREEGSGDRSDRPLGEKLTGRFGDVDVDSVEAVRAVREDG